MSEIPALGGIQSRFRTVVAWAHAGYPHSAGPQSTTVAAGRPNPLPFVPRQDHASPTGLYERLEEVFRHDTLETFPLAFDPVLQPITPVGKKARDPEGLFSRSHTDPIKNVSSESELVRCGRSVPYTLVHMRGHEAFPLEEAEMRIRSRRSARISQGVRPPDSMESLERGDRSEPAISSCRDFERASFRAFSTANSASSARSWLSAASAFLLREYCVVGPLPSRFSPFEPMALGRKPPEQRLEPFAALPDRPETRPRSPPVHPRSARRTSITPDQNTICS